MDGGSSTQGHEERGAEKMMDDYLKSLDLHRKKIAKDGSCLFRAVAEQVTVDNNLHDQLPQVWNAARLQAMSVVNADAR